MKLAFTSAVLLLLALGACSALTNPEPVVCTTEFRFGLQVFVRDSVSGAYTAMGAQLIDVDQKGRADTNSVAFTDSTSLSGAGEHAGIFTVTVRKSGYHDWIRRGVVVTADQCHVHTTTLTALLQPLP